MLKKFIPDELINIIFYLTMQKYDGSTVMYY